MKLVYQIHNIGIYLDNDADINWYNRMIINLRIPLDGFEIYIDEKGIEYSIYIKNFSELNSDDYIVVPDSSKYYESSGVFVTIEGLNLGYKVDGNRIYLWASDDLTFIPYLLELLFRKQNITFVHGASIVKNGKGILLLAFGGIGKTSFVSKAVNSDNVKLLGDDLILISNDGHLYSYPRPFCLYKYHIDLFPQYFNNNNVKYVTIKNNMYFKRALRKLKKMLNIKDRNVYDYLTVSPLKLFDKSKIQIDPVMINTVYVLRRKNDINSINLSNAITNENASNFAHSVILHEWLAGIRYFLNEYAQKFDNYLEPLADKYNIIKNCISFAKQCYLVDIPNSMSAEEVCDELNKLIIGE